MERERYAIGVDDSGAMVSAVCFSSSSSFVYLSPLLFGVYAAGSSSAWGWEGLDYGYSSCDSL